MHRWLILIVGVATAQRIISRTQIEAQGYSVEKVGMPYGLVPAGKNSFAYVEYWAQGKPKPGWYIECLNTEFYTQWSQLIDFPKAGEGRPIRLLKLKESIVALSYEEDPLTRGVIQEVGKFHDVRSGKPLLPKWTAISTYDRAPAGASSGIVIGADSVHFLWYAYQVSKKGTVERGWYAVWHQSGRKVASATDWTPAGLPITLALDARQSIWTVEKALDRSLSVVCYDTRARTTRSWKISADTALYMPKLLCTPRGVYLTGLLSGAKTIPHTEAPIGRWILGYLPFPLADTSDFQWSIQALPEDWLSIYKEPTNFAVKDLLVLGDSVVYALWEDTRIKGSTTLSYDIWVTRWRKEEGAFAYHWAYRIEKRQKEPDIKMVSFLRGLSETFLTIAFLTERTGKGKLLAYQINHQTGEANVKEIGSNAAGDLLLLPGEAAYLSAQEVVCLALAPPAKNGYQLYHIRL